MKAKEYLLQVKKLDQMIQNKKVEKEMWMSMALSTTAPSDGERVQSSGSQQKMADAVTRSVGLDEEIEKCIVDLFAKKQEVIQTIEKLSLVDYDVLHQVYIQNRDFYDVAEKYGRTYSWVTTAHGRALKHLQEMLDAKEKLKEMDKIHE